MDDVTQGYIDGGNPTNPWPGNNTSAMYRHGFEVRRREMQSLHWNVEEAKRRADLAEKVDKGLLL